MQSDIAVASQLSVFKVDILENDSLIHILYTSVTTNFISIDGNGAILSRSHDCTRVQLFQQETPDMLLYICGSLH